MGTLLSLRFLFIILWPTVATSTLPMAKPYCRYKCGEIQVPYPFGFGDKECFRDEGFGLTCDETHYNPPKLFYQNAEVVNISLQGQVQLMSNISQDCYTSSGLRTYWNIASLHFTNSPFTISNTKNIFMVLGCDTWASITGSIGNHFSSTGCNMTCGDNNYPTESSCSGNGCCQTFIPKGFQSFVIEIGSYYNHTKVWKYNPCGYAFLIDMNWFNFSGSSNNSHSSNNTNTNGNSGVPIMLDWAIEQKNGSSCKEAGKDITTYACGRNSDCFNSTNGLGYSCNCSEGYHGNPYLSDGCQDINECAYPINPCNWTCTNLPGSYSCSCPPDYYGDGRKDGSGCIPSPKPYPMLQVTLGIGLSSLFLLFGILLMVYLLQKRKNNKLKQKFFEQNGGFLLKQQLSSREGPIEAAKIFTAKELKQATNNYAQTQILGHGGNGTVYKGILPDQRLVAIKKSKRVDESQIEQFINEVVILSQINHRNVVKLLGCCLETEVPILVYEFVTNKTLFHHIHGEGCNNSQISWDIRLRIAVETSEAIAYLHSAASPPIIHRDIKSSNILLDDNYMAKVSDFGVSRLVPLDYTQISTLVQGTWGYLDPEYFRSSQLTEKSDVYSFGVVLVELLTGKKALDSDGPDRDSNLALHFVTRFEEGNVWDIIDDRIMIEGCKMKLKEVLKIAERCLRVRGKERPTMKEVAMELQRLRMDQRYSSVAQNIEEVECQFIEPSDLYSHDTIGYDSLTNDGGR
ncbi:wall-associated receptor kinase 2-like [Telopea speciosissima]|uniref:wall-associated receptor kinase 2-like n=1 Tax=Telopea speciosissima TaxID=54955 RepID=UPI001CC66B53|nr:wall-associated receptor kinase 2-like [Telopea speciosissima]